jgi:hypothetical protein
VRCVTIFSFYFKKSLEGCITQMLIECMTRCTICGAEILFVRTKKGKLMPIEHSSALPNELYNLEQHGDEIQYNAGPHRPHFAACADWKKREKKRLEQIPLRFGE